MDDYTRHSIDWGEGCPDLYNWYHLAMTYGNADLKLYINGQLKNSMGVTGELRSNNRGVSFGSDNGF